MFSILTTLLLVIAIQVLGVQAEARSLPLVALGTEDTPQVCIGILIGAQHVLVHSDCASTKGDMTIGRVLDLDLPTSSPSNSTKTVTTQTAALGSAVALANSTKIPFQQLPSNASSSAHSVHVVAVEDPLPLGFHQPVTLPLKMPYPAYLDVDHSAFLVSINLASLSVSLTQAAIFVDDSSCNHTVCALPVEVEDRDPHTEPNQWSFLLTQSSEGGKYRLLGAGGSPVTDHNGIWGFEWLPQALAGTNLPSLGVYGVNTVVSVNKEIFEGKDVKTTSEYTEFIVGLRDQKEGTTFCSGALIAPKWVLTSVGCKTKYLPTWVVVDTLETSGKPTEALAIQRMLPHPEFMVAGLNYNFMLVQLDRASSRRPIKYNKNKDDTSQITKATAFGYGATSFRSDKMNHRLRSNKVGVIGAESCPESIRDWLDKTTMCVRKSLCYGDYGGPVVTNAWSSDHELYGIIGNDFYCYNLFYYNVVGRVSAVSDWITKTMKKFK
ncbi:hypothetical protein Poli38472_011500 [Pythium oligandrum]|uniref:Peptidase S1 domain-containing protein n=1 Tax=Pythium oligandrum TaxID=41045 RepID=A0A8K1FI53_PYTOL|nr:hypothetical protein Poli38472_011500 [Pythium oligandrum]|eukprot:TMW64620.1 hypothetical protein Poli38472_011500 [Pythium oligandrum]